MVGIDSRTGSDSSSRANSSPGTDSTLESILRALGIGIGIGIKTENPIPEWIPDPES